jgi:formylglycine-generating enzyme required for sulfatase activity
VPAENERGLCFVLMPMRGDFIDLYDGVIKPTVQDCGLECVHAGEIFGAKLIMEDIWTHIERARVVVADLTGRNVNVFYEVGYAHAFDKHKVVLITQSMEDVPFDLQGFRCIRYQLGPSGLRRLGKDLTNQLQAVLSTQPTSRQAPETATAPGGGGIVTSQTRGVPKRVPPPPPERLGRDMRSIMPYLSEDGRAILELRFGFRDGQTRTLEQVAGILDMAADVAREGMVSAFDLILRRLESGAVVPTQVDLEWLLSGLDELGKEYGLPRAITITIEGIEMTHVRGGSFLMGDENVYEARPLRYVHVDGFYLGRYAVTNVQYKAFLVATGYSLPSHWRGGVWPDGKEHHPVVNVSWRDAVEYCSWLSRHTARYVRLPTEAEWEKAASWDCEADRKRVYPWGNVFDSSKCNTRDSEILDTTAVVDYSPGGDSPYGIADMAGNVYEWTSSLVRDYPYDADDGREDPADDGKRVLRGGSWREARPSTRCAARTGGDPTMVSGEVGFRCAMDPSVDSGRLQSFPAPALPE